MELVPPSSSKPGAHRGAAADERGPRSLSSRSMRRVHGPPRSSQITTPGMPAVVVPDAVADVQDRPASRQTMVEPLEIGWTSSVRRDRAMLLRLAGPSEEHVVFLDESPLSVGRASESDLWIDEEDVSRAHAEVRFEGGRHVVVDLGSKNGLVVRGQRVHHGVLADGDVIQFGSHAAFRYTMMDAIEADLVRKLYDSSVRDPLTRAYNRRHFEERLGAEIAYAVRHHTDLGLLLVDLDRFKSVNDTYGHRAGDAALAFVAALVMSRLRTEDLLARYGGEEFVVLLRGNDLASAASAGHRLRAAIATSAMLHEGATIPVTVSIGVSSLRTLAVPTADALVAVADERLYAAKRNGRNQVVARST